MTATIAASADFIQSVEAKKSAGSDTPGRISPNSFGSATSGIVCGDRLCSETGGTTECLAQKKLWQIKQSHRQF